MACVSHTHTHTHTHRNVLAENNYYEKGHGVSIGSETSGWVYNVTVR